MTKGVTPALIFVWCLLHGVRVTASQSQAVDGTEVACRSGCEVVTAVITKIRQAGIFEYDYQFIERLSYLLSGNNQNNFICVTSDLQYGIWRGTASELSWSKTEPTLDNIRQEILAKLYIEWINVEVKDLKKPIYSGLLAYMKFSSSLLKSSLSLVPTSVNDQADFLVAHYYKDMALPVTTSGFVNAANNLIKDCDDCRQTAGSDIVFVVDASGSVGSYGFDLSKDFVSETIRAFNTNGWMTRFGIIVFEDIPHLEIKLSDFTDKQSLLDAVDKLTYYTGSTGTRYAIDLMSASAFTTSNGARPVEEGVPKIGIVITDGMSNVGGSPCASAEAARASGTSMIAVGVGNYDESELKCIVGDGNHDKIFRVSDYTQIQHIESALKSTSCKESVEITNQTIIQRTILENQKIFFKRNNNCTDDYQQETQLPFVQVKMTVATGRAELYVGNYPNPSPELHQWKTAAIPGYPGSIYIKRSDIKQNFVYHTVTGKEDNTQLSLEVKCVAEIPQEEDEEDSVISAEHIIAIVLAVFLCAFIITMVVVLFIIYCCSGKTPPRQNIKVMPHPQPQIMTARLSISQIHMTNSAMVFD